MNQVFRPYLRIFVLVFFDNILVYGKSWGEHIQHLERVLSILQYHQLYAKRFKCQFGLEKIEYLGHIISFEGVSTDPTKIEGMLS